MDTHSMRAVDRCNERQTEIPNIYHILDRGVKRGQRTALKRCCYSEGVNGGWDQGVSAKKLMEE